jgi:uncharacterized membrane protein YidH (DUF202 family)
MSLRLVLGSAIGCAVAVALAALVFDLRFERAVVLAPVIVVSVGALAALVVLWTRVAWESLRHSRHPWRIVAAGLTVFALLIVLSFFVGPLPHE